MVQGASQGLLGGKGLGTRLVGSTVERIHAHPHNILNVPRLSPHTSALQMTESW